MLQRNGESYNWALGKVKKIGQIPKGQAKNGMGVLLARKRKESAHIAIPIGQAVKGQIDRHQEVLFYEVHII